MNNPRLYEVAKNLGMPANELLDKLKADGFSVNTNFNAVGPKMYEHIMKNYVKDGSEAKKEPVKPQKTEPEEKKSSNFESKGFVVRYVPKDKVKTQTAPAPTKKEEAPVEAQKEDIKQAENKEEPKVEVHRVETHKVEVHKVEQKESPQQVEEPKAENVHKEEKKPEEQKKAPVQQVAKVEHRQEKRVEARPHVQSQSRPEHKSDRDRNEKRERSDRNDRHDRDERKKPHQPERQVEKVSRKQAVELTDVPVADKPSKDKWQQRNDKPKKSQFDDSFGSEGGKSKNKKKKNKRAKNIIDEKMRTQLENTDLNFEKKTPGKKKKKVRNQNDHIEIFDEVEVDEMSVVAKERMTVKDFAELIGKAPNDIILKLMNLGVMAALNQYIDYEVMEIVADDFGIKLETKEDEIDTDLVDYDYEDDEKDLIKRAPVVTVMGHVDHGKTSLLDAIRSTNVTVSEAGGITQHIGASEVIINGQKIVFLDTPGHEAFTSLRARGVQLTDIAILVVAADDGVMPQTIEAIDHARAANVPIIVAINKIDKPGADPDRVIKELSQNGVLVEDWGGDVVSVKVSAKKKENIDALLEMVILVADMMELKANPNRNAIGTIIEANLDKGRGPVATVLVQNGTLKISDPYVCGTTYGRVRAMYDHRGRNVTTAGPSTAVEVIGMSDVPMAGDRFHAVNEDREARRIADKRALEIRAGLAAVNQKVSLQDLFSQIQAGNLKVLNLIIKADVHGSIEAIKQSLDKLKSDEVKINIQHANIGTITESDIMLATASNTIILGFNVRPSAAVLDLAKKQGVEIKTYRIIYELLSDVEAALTGMLAPKYVERQLGEVEVRTIFKVPGVGTIAGSYVTSGKVTRNSNIRLLRAGVIVFEGKLQSLKRFKDDVKEVMQGYECGLNIEGFNDIKEGDVIEAYEIDEVKQTL